MVMKKKLLGLLFTVLASSRCETTEPSVLLAPKILAQHQCGLNLFSTKEGFKKQSKQNISRLRKNLGDLEERDTQLIRLSNQFPPAVIHRTSDQKYSQIQKTGVIKSPAYAAKTGAANEVTHSGYYSSAEELLFNSSSCVFASLGPCDGRARYGEVKICLGDLPDLENHRDRFIWASHTAGFELARRQGLSGEVLINAFKETVVVPEDFRDFMAFFMIDRLRKLPANERERIVRDLEQAATLPPQQASRRWWTIIDENRLGYLEVKFDQFIPREAIQSVENPKNVNDAI